MTDNEYNNFDAIRFFSEYCGSPISKSGEETLFRCPRSNGKEHRISVTTSGQWKCFHANCAAKSGCSFQKGGPRQFLNLTNPGLSDPEAFEVLNKHGRMSTHKSGSESQFPSFPNIPKSPKKIWPHLQKMVDSMPNWSNVTTKTGKPAKYSNMWEYLFPDGKIAFAVIRFNGPAGKIYIQIHPVPGGWQTGGIESSRPLYRLHELPKDLKVPVIVTEGEKCADSLQKFLKDNGSESWVTTPSQGAQSPQKTDWTPLKGRSVLIIPDNDQAGINFSQAVARLANEAGAAKVSISKPFGAPSSGFDIADQIEINGSDPAAIMATITLAEKVNFDELPIENKDTEPAPNPALTIQASSCLRFLENEPRQREFIVKDFLPRLNVGVIAAPGGTGKGYFTLQLALSVATGIKFLRKFDIENPGGVLYCNSEDDEPEIHRRFLSCLREVLRGIGKDEAKEAVGALGERFYAPSLTGKHRLTLYPDEGGKNKRDLMNLARSIPDLRLIILDPANRIMAGDFNRVEEVTAFIQSLEEIATETGATILLVTHTNKSSQTGNRDDKHSAGAVLGSQSFVNAARWVMTLSTFDDSMRKKFQFAGPLEAFVSLRIPKANYLKPGLGELHMKRVDEEDESGLGSGPLRLVDLGKKEKEVTPEDVAQWVGENPGLSKTSTRDAIKGKFGTPHLKTWKAIDEAVKKGLIFERKDKNSGRGQLLFPGGLAENEDTVNAD